ncbi:scavenger receptor class B member 1-like [Battus philenor]|uniref:scavenger receptor class B member 1-like n=1 Tax=Battus philenor TaxID=42288 RepID=UPI0035CED704
MKPGRECDRLSTASRKKLIILITLGICFMVIGLTCSLVDPVLIIARHQLNVIPGTRMYNGLTSEITGAYVSAYFFNVTNSERFLSGEDHQLKVQEVGPFTYIEKRFNTHFEVDYEKQVMRYQPFVNTTFVPELSIDDPENVNITIPNTALLSIATAMSSYPFWSKMALNMLIRRFDSKPIMSMTAQEFLWGYDEPLLAFGHTLLPGYINFDKFGFFDRLYDNTRDYRMELSLKEESRFQILSVNGHAGFPYWGYEDPSKRSRCNSFVDAYEGFAYPPGLPHDRPLRLYRNLFCRILEIDYVETRRLDFCPEAYLFKISDRTYKMNNDTECLCSHYGCHEGMSDLSPCFYGLPTMMSNGHFYGADPKVYERVEGLAPDEERHGSSFMIDPKLGTALTFSMTVQLNVPVSDVGFNTNTAPFSNMMVPIAYFKVTMPELDDWVKTLFWLLYILGPRAVLVVELISLTAGLCLLAIATRILYGNWVNNRLRVSKTPLRSEVPLMQEKL